MMTSTTILETSKSHMEPAIAYMVCINNKISTYNEREGFFFNFIEVTGT